MARKMRSKQPAFDSRDSLLDARVDHVLDLHGYSATETTSAVRKVLEVWGRRKPGAVVHIVTGKGKGSPNGPVLRSLVKRLLQGELRAMLVDYGLDEAEGGFKVRLR